MFVSFSFDKYSNLHSYGLGTFQADFNINYYGTSQNKLHNNLQWPDITFNI